MEDIIVCKGLNKYYSGVHALKDLSLEIKKDSVVGLKFYLAHISQIQDKFILKVMKSNLSLQKKQ